MRKLSAEFLLFVVGFVGSRVELGSYGSVFTSHGPSAKRGKVKRLSEGAEVRSCGSLWLRTTVESEDVSMVVGTGQSPAW